MHFYICYQCPTHPRLFCVFLLHLSGQHFLWWVGEAVSPPVSLHPPPGAFGILPVGLFCFTGCKFQHLVYFFYRDSQPCTVWSVSWGLCYWGFFWWLNISDIFGGGSEMVRWNYDDFHASWLAWSTDILGSIRSCHRVTVFPTALFWRFLWTFVLTWLLCYFKGSQNFSVGLLHKCKQCPVKYSLWLLFLVVHFGKGFDGVSTHLSVSISFVAIVPRVIWGGENWI